MRPRRLEAADVLGFPQDGPRGNWRIEAFERLRPKRLQLESAAEQPPRRLCDHDAPWLGQRLQPRGQVGRIADDRLLLRRALPDEIADHDNAGRDADADLKPILRAGIEFRDNRQNVQARPDGSFRVLLMRSGKTEIREHAVAHEFGDEAV